MPELELEKTIENSIISKSQENFLKTTFGKTINSAIDIGIKSIMPDLIENEIINIKDAIIENGLKEGLNEAISSGINFGKSAIGIITGEFENTEQLSLAVKKGGILDNVSKLLDYSLNVIQNKKILDKSVVGILKNGKNSLISSISNKLEETLTNQIKAVEKIEKYCKNWNEAYGNQDILNMEKSYKNIKSNFSKIIPLENIIKEARKIENIQSLIVSKGNQFNLTEEELLLAQKI